jgi:hypothetical protein
MWIFHVYNLEFEGINRKVPICRPYRALRSAIVGVITNLPPLQGLDLTTGERSANLSPLQGFVKCYSWSYYQSVAPTGLCEVLQLELLPICRPYRALCNATVGVITNLSPLQGFVECYSWSYYQSAALTGLGFVSREIFLPSCRPYRAWI